MINVPRSQQGKFHARLIRQWIRFENMFVKEIQPILNSQFSDSAALVAAGDLEIDSAVNEYKPEMSKELRDHYTKVSEFYYDETINQLEKSFYIGRTDIKDSESIFWSSMRNFIRIETAKKIVRISNTTRNIIRGIIQKGIKDGLTNYEMSKDILSKSKISNKHRARMIAGTETHGAYGKATFESVKSTPTRIDMKGWFSVGDIRTRDPHIDADGESVKVDEKFVNTGESLDYPGDPAGSGWNVIRCRCTVNYFTQR